MSPFLHMRHPSSVLTTSRTMNLSVMLLVAWLSPPLPLGVLGKPTRRSYANTSKSAYPTENERFATNESYDSERPTLLIQNWKTTSTNANAVSPIVVPVTTTRISRARTMLKVATTIRKRRTCLPMGSASNTAREEQPPLGG